MTRLQTVLKSALLAAASVAAIGAVRADVLFSLPDVRGDDFGNGALIYPNRDDITRGDLDLVSLSVEQRADGIWFVAEMGQAIRSPVGKVTEIGQNPMDRIARNGFYTFNIDIYIDKDRIIGSGQTGTVPGRNVTVDRAFAWEKCIVLTPRPDIARTMLLMYFDDVLEADLRSRKGRVSEEDVDVLQTESSTKADALFFFPNKVRVNGRRIEFQVPTDFLGGVPQKSWGYTAIVTGADLDKPSRPGQLGSDKQEMLTMGVARGIRFSQWGIRSDADEATPPVIDLLSPDPSVQKNALSNYDMVVHRLAAVPGVAPDGNVAVAGTGEEPPPDELSRITLVPPTLATAGAKAPAERRSVPARLRTLNELLAEGLITQAEYNDMRRKILAEL
ncbi:MAG TPA: glucodextranase DOMON-like domain-containing protein [Steroidobacteraceae bacterium]